MRAQILANKSESDPGLVGKVLAEHGFELVLNHRRELPAAKTGDFGPKTADLLVLLGSGWSAYDPEVTQFVAAETAILRDWLEAGKPVLAICFGAQLAAQALGARVLRAPAPEIGWHRVNSRVMAIDCGPWMQWHYDIFEVPAGGKLLAENHVGPQAFSVGSMLATQFHPEATYSIVASWSDGDGERELEAVDVRRTELLDRTKHEVERTTATTRTLVEWHLNGMCDA